VHITLLWLNLEEFSVSSLILSMQTLDWKQLHSFDEEEDLPASLSPLRKLVIVGLTGVGKTTTLELLANRGVMFTLLPNRRKITDEVIIATLQREGGQLPQPVTDRITRFEYTARYRAKHPGGMAYAVSRLAVDPTGLATPLIFDGLRGLEEVERATFYFPQARFILLDAPDIVRLRRLLKRVDLFDTTASQNTANHPDLVSRLAAIPHVETVFNPETLNQMARMAQADQELNEEIIQKVSIIVKERHNYDSRAACSYLIDTLPPERLLVIDTAAHPARTVVEQVVGWLAVRQ
jgi:hypothetical protein